MPFSKFFAFMAAIGVIPVLIGSFIGLGFYIFISYNILLLILLTVDLVISPRKRHFEAERLCEEKFSLGADNEIAVKIRNNSRFIVSMTIKDEVPAFFEIREHEFKIAVPPHSDHSGKYHVIPQKRGCFTFGTVSCRYSGVMKLCSRTVSFNLAKDYKVYPNLKDLGRYSLAVLRKSQLSAGDKKAKAYSMGTEFESLREYCKGDDYRKINWLATARANKLIVNSYEPEKNQQVIIMLDSSRVMNSEINYIKKLDYAINSSFLLADIATKKGDNTGLMVFDSDIRRFIKPGKGPYQFQLIADSLYNIEENLVTADYKGALAYLDEHQMRRSLLCIFTELFNKDEALELISALKGIARRHIPLVITIKDMRLYDMARGELADADDLFNKSAAIRLTEEREKIREVFRDAGVPCIDVPPDRLSIETVNRYLSMKELVQI